MRYVLALAGAAGKCWWSVAADSQHVQLGRDGLSRSGGGADGVAGYL